VSRLQWTLNLVINNFGWKVLALATALVIWVLVANEPELSTFTTVRLEYRNLPDGLEISAAPTENVTLELRGPVSELSGVGASRAPSVVLDMSNAVPGQHTFTITRVEVTLAPGVRLVRAIPSQVRFDFDRRMVRSIPVLPQFVGGFPAGGYIVAPPDLTIAGPANRVSKIQAAGTDPIDLGAPTSEYRVNAFVADPYVRLQSAAEVLVIVRKRNT
jgi:hypothetical protein